MERDTQIFDIIDKECQRQEQGLELIASENFVSPQVMEAMGTCLTNKYAEGYPKKRYYGGCHFIDESEQLAIDRAKELFGAEWVNVQPHSGAQANMAVMTAIIDPGDKVLGLDLSHGGHLTHGAPVNFSGKFYENAFYGVEEESGRIDYDKVEEIAHREQPKLIITGASAYPRDWDYKRFRQIADEVGAILICDMAHTAGLIAKGLLNDPLPHCDVVTTTTHKTLRGPRGGMILTNEKVPNPMGIQTRSGKTKYMTTVLDSSVFPGTQGGPLEHVIAAKAVSFKEALSDEFQAYAQQVVKNAQHMAQCFMEKDYDVISGGTDNHLVLIDLRNKGVTGKQAEDALVDAEITVNKNMVPFDDQSPFVTSGIRVGVPAVTTRGMEEKEMEQIVEWMDYLIQSPDDDSRIKKVREKVLNFTQDFPLYRDE